MCNRQMECSLTLFTCIVHMHCSHDCQTGQKEKGNIVPETFPGVLRISPNHENKPMLNARYAKFGSKGVPEFEYFIKNLLSRVQPKRTRFRMLQGHHPISQLFTASDEAFALIILDNELHVWDQQIEKKKGTGGKKSDLRMKKKYMREGNGKGSRCGWSKAGMKIYKKLTDEIQAQRMNEWRDKEEKLYQEKFAKELGLQPTTSFGLPRAPKEDNDSDSEVEFGGEDAFEDFRPKHWRSI